jgi:hypothetical protein
MMENVLNLSIGILDKGLDSPEILNFLKAKPRYHLFGDVHATANKDEISNNTRFSNIYIL